MKRIVVSLLLALLLSACVPVLGEDVFRVGMECEYVPFTWTQTEPSEFAVPIVGGMG